MKNLVFIFLVTLLVTACVKNDGPTQQQITNEGLTPRSLTASTAIGEVVAGQAVLTVSTSSLITNLNQFLAAGGNANLAVDFVELVTQSNGELVLRGSSSSTNVSTTVLLTVSGGFIYEELDINGGGNTCSCSGCTSSGPSSYDECIANKTTTGCWCSACSQGKCTKTTTAGVGPSLTQS